MINAHKKTITYTYLKVEKNLLNAEHENTALRWDYVRVNLNLEKMVFLTIWKELINTGRKKRLSLQFS